ncbi:MAG: hypothetical protein JWP57_943 [Spirosoma sp.]|nr:hypothetical protein [Spirosoma sp.]
MLMQPGQTDGKWINLGGDFAGSVVVLLEKRSLAIFGLTPQGKVLTAEWDPQEQEEVRWQTIDGKPFSFLYAGKDNGTTHLIGLTADPQILALSRQHEPWSDRWTSLGTLDDVHIENTDTTTEMV